MRSFPPPRRPPPGPRGGPASGQSPGASRETRSTLVVSPVSADVPAAWRGGSWRSPRVTSTGWERRQVGGLTHWHLSASPPELCCRPTTVPCGWDCPCPGVPHTVPSPLDLPCNCRTRAKSTRPPCHTHNLHSSLLSVISPYTTILRSLTTPTPYPPPPPRAPSSSAE